MPGLGELTTESGRIWMRFQGFKAARVSARFAGVTCGSERVPVTLKAEAPSCTSLKSSFLLMEAVPLTTKLALGESKVASRISTRGPRKSKDPINRRMRRGEPDSAIWGRAPSRRLNCRVPCEDAASSGEETPAISIVYLPLAVPRIQ